MISRPLSDGQKRILEALTTRYEEGMPNSPASAYLESRSLGSVISRLRFGVVSSPAPGHEYLAGRLVIPGIGPRGNIYSARFRCLQNHDCKESSCPKYLGMPGFGSRLYNSADLVAGDEIHITEGELDAATLVAAGLSAVAVSGANNWKDHYRPLFAGYYRVVIWGDGDEAGRKFVALVRRKLSYQSIDVVMAPQGQDVNSMAVRQGFEHIRKLANNTGGNE